MGKKWIALAWLMFAGAAAGSDNVFSPDAVVRQLEKLLHDEQSGVSRPVPSPYWGDGGRVPAREQRKQLIQKTFAGEGSPDLVPVIDWVLRHERLVESQSAAARMLEKIEGAGAEQLVEQLLREPHPANEVVAVLAPRYVRMAGAREEVLAALASHSLPQVRSVARSALTTRGRTTAPFDEASLITPRLRASLASVLSLAVTPVSTQAKLVEIDLAKHASWDRERSNVRGFLIGEGGGRLQVLSSDLAEREVSSEEIVRRADLPVSEEVARVTKLRGSRDGARQLSSRGGLTAQFEPRFVSGWEVFLGAWLLARGDVAMAGRLLAPVLEQCPDERFIYEVARDQWATRLLHGMLEEFSGARDRAATLRFARHLAAQFAGHSAQRLAAKLVRELTVMDATPKLELPVPDAWKKLAAGMSRAQKLEYLLDRLVLLNCIQQSQPGGVSFRDPQFQESMRSLMRTWRGQGMPPQVINPFVEIQALPLSVADIPVLASRLLDDRYIPTFSYWRDFHPSRHLYTVTEVVGQLIDEIARTQLAHAEEFLEADAVERKATVERIVAWSKANASVSETDRLMEILRTSRLVGSMYYDELVKSLEKLNAKKAAPVLLGRLADKGIWDHDIAYLLNAASRLDAQATVSTASKYLDHAKPGVQLAAGCVIYQHGDRAAGRRALASALARGTYSDLSLYDVLPAVRALVAVGGPEDLDAARIVFSRDYFDQGRESDRAPVVEAFGDKAGPTLYAFYLRQINNTRADGGSTVYQQGKPPRHRTFAQDAAREFLQTSLGKRSAVTWPADETESAKSEVMRRLKTWLEEQR